VKTLALFLIRLVTPDGDREWIVGDTLEEVDRLERAHGSAAVRRWLLGELFRVLLNAPRHRLAARSSARSNASRERIVRVKGDRPMSAIWQDVRYATRMLRRSPGFTAIAVLTLALGIGGNAAMFAAVNAVLFKSLPFQDSDRLMLVHRLVPDWEGGPSAPMRQGVWSYPKYRTFLELQQSFDDTALFALRDISLAGDGDPERVRGEVVTERYPAVLGIHPITGRSFTYGEAHHRGADRVVIIGHGLWTRRYGGDARIIGRLVPINGTPHTIVGVFPRGFKGLNGNAELWVPLATMEPEFLDQRENHSYTIIAKRKGEVDESAAVAAVEMYGQQIDDQYRTHDSPARSGAIAVSLDASRADPDVRRAALVVLGAVGFVLLIACVNLTNLLVAKALGRRREVAIRSAIGASRSRIARQFGVESLLLAVMGALGGLAVASLLLSLAEWLLPDSDVFFRTSIAPGTPRIAGAAGLTRIGASLIGLDATTLAFTAAITIATAVLVALLPAWQASAPTSFDALKTTGSAGAARGFHALGARAMLVTTQIALALVLLVGAGLMIKSAIRLRDTSIGVDADRVLTLRLDLFGPRFTPDTRTAFYQQLVDRIRAVHGVEFVGLGSCPPVSGSCNGTSLWVPGTPRLGVGKDPLVGIYWATPDYFSTLGIRVLRGRGFVDSDRSGQPKVLLINEAAARTFWPNVDPIGKIVAVGQGGFHDGATIVGVVSNVRYKALDAAATPDVYVPLWQSGQARMRVFVRSQLDTASLISALSRQVHALDPNLPLSEIKTMDERLGDAMWRTRVSAWLLSAFAALALLLTAIGVFGVMAQTVTQRTPEIGIRMALGAQRRDVLKLVLGRAAIVTGCGVALGVGSALGLTRLIAALLYGVDAADPGTFAAVSLVLATVALTACYIPARRATRIDAVVALRSE
jgi:putative ABC transport system permease protein